MRARSKGQELSAVGQTPRGENTSQAEQLEALEQEHRLLTELRERLHEAIGLLETVEKVKPDAAARLERYRLHEEGVTRRRRNLKEQIRWLRDSSDDPGVS